MNLYIMFLRIARFSSSACCPGSHCFRPATWKKDGRIFSRLAGGTELPSLQVIILILQAYLEYLAKCCLSELNLANNLVALWTLHRIHGLPTASFQNQRLPLFLEKSFTPKIHKALKIETLERIMAISKSLEHSNTFIALYSLSFLLFLVPLQFAATHYSSI